jgi:hypothetical protein
MKDNNMNDQLDSAVDAVKADLPALTAIEGARDRVLETLSREQASQSKLSLETHEDYVSAIPAYLANQLSDAAKVAFEAESRHSLPLRRSLKVARQLLLESDEESVKSSGLSFFGRITAVAAVLAVIAVSLLILPEVPTFDQTAVAQVGEVNGELYRVEDGQLKLLVNGEWIGGQTKVRTGKDSLAILYLDDGSRVEVNSRSELSVTRRQSGNRIDIERGNIIVEASPQGSGTLDVATNEFVVSVTGTIFEVGHGAMGSRVGVIEGQVEVLQKGDSTSVTPGSQMGSRSGLAAYHVENELAWSQDADKYIAMLQSAAELGRNISAVMDSEPRYSTRLLDLMPESTAIYLAVPNAPEKITEVYQLMKSHMQAEGFADVMEGIDHAGKNQKVDELMSWLAEVGGELGDETVLSMVMQGSAGDVSMTPVVLSEIDAATFAASFEERVAGLDALFAESDSEQHPEIVLIKHPDEAVTGNLSIWLTSDLLIATTNADTMLQMQRILSEGKSDFAGSRFHAQLSESYRDGAEVLMGVHLADVIARFDGDTAGLRTVGLSDAEFLIAERTQTNSEATIDASLLFASERSGVMSWLANPGPMGALEFFSVYTTVVTSFVTKDPSVILDELEAMALTLKAGDAMSDAAQGQETDAKPFELDIDWRNNVIAALGGEVAVGLDGPAFPTPGWKAVVEVYDELRLQDSIEAAIRQINQHGQNEAKAFSLAISPANHGAYSGYLITASVREQAAQQERQVTLQYVYIDGYLVAAPNMAMMEKAVTLYQARAGLLTSQEFINQLPKDAGLDFSAMTFSRIGNLINEVIDRMPSGLSEEQQRVVKRISGGAGPTMVSVYAAPESLRFIHQGDMAFPFSMSQLLGMGVMKGLANGDDLDEVLGDGFEEQMETKVQQKFKQRRY